MDFICIVSKFVYSYQELILIKASKPQNYLPKNQKIDKLNHLKQKIEDYL